MKITIEADTKEIAELLTTTIQQNKDLDEPFKKLVSFLQSEQRARANSQQRVQLERSLDVLFGESDHKTQVPHC